MPIDVSIVSHGQGHLASQLLQDMQALGCALARVHLTHNLPDLAPLPQGVSRFSAQTNPRPLGFAGNHNQAFAGSREDFLCVVNPDIRLDSDPFPALLRCMEDPRVGLAAPVVYSPAGTVEDSMRRFPTPLHLARKGLGLDDGSYRIEASVSAAPRPVEWVAGMFMLFRAEAFRDVGGFDDKFHLYYEDVDMCARLWKRGWKVVGCPQASVVHHAQRASRHNIRYMAWHASSMARYFLKHLGRLPRLPDPSSAHIPPAL
jgi:N-acetylglucosaminyl-diphospho-decaprenol L-rhamnosyltransferase